MIAKEIFLEAVSRAAAERQAFVAEACGDDAALRADVESLLAFHQDDASVVSEPSASGPAREQFTPGELFGRRYRMIVRIGRGGMGDVWRADDLVLDTPVALKLIHTPSEGTRKRILNEVRVARQVTHPAVCRVFDVGEDVEHVFYTMELVEGDDLDALLRRAGRLPSEKVIDIAHQLCAGLAAAHAHGVLHRDLKPANILIDDNGSIRIADFGIAVTKDADRNTGAGTPAYMAPEQCAPGARLTERTDVYALGLVLYELVTGHAVAFTADMNPIRPSALVHDVSPPLERAILRAIAQNPADRPESAVAVAAMLPKSSVRRDVVPAVASAPQSGRWIPSWRLGLALAVVAIAVVAALPFLVTRGSRGLTDQDTVILADFVNTTGEPVFDGTLKVALAVALEQSPFLKVFPDERARETLRLMGRAPDERVTRAIAREIAQREQLKALLSGSIARLGRNYVLSLEAINSQTGDVMARNQVEVDSQEQVLTSLGRAASTLRQNLGESLGSIQKFDVPLPRATTPSLEALHAYALALDQDRLVARAGAIPHLQRAIELDPNFALAQALLSGIYANTRRTALAPEFSKRAFDLRDRVSERERFFISWRYYHDATQEWEKALDLARSWTATYPREPFAFNSLGVALSFFGQQEQAVAAFREGIRLDPMFIAVYENLASTLIALNRFDESAEIVQQAVVRRSDLISLRRFEYLLAFVAGDTRAAASGLEAALRQPDATSAANWEARAAAFRGQMDAAHDRYRRAVAIATQAGATEMAALWSVEDAEAHAVAGRCDEARSDVAAALELSRDNFTLERAARALALCGAAAEATSLSRELASRFPDATQILRVQAPVIGAALAIRRGDAAHALDLLEPVKPYDHLRGAEFWPPYLRGHAHLLSKEGREAAAQFESILARRGEAPDSPLYPLAQLGLARAAALMGDRFRANQSYEAFFASWSDADPNLEPLVDAKREYAFERRSQPE